MPFSAFSKDFTANMFTSVENQFITKYLPQANGDAVRVYLYGLYLCSCKQEIDEKSVAKLLKLTPERLLECYDFWEECDLVHILSREPLYVEYLPVNAAVGTPKPIRPEKYADFNRELLRRLNKVGKDFKPYEMQRILEFLENNPMEQQAFLLVVEYCIRKDGEKVSAAHILNKAKKLCDAQKFTYEQAESDLADYNKHEHVVAKIFTLMGIYRKPQEQDYDLYAGWTEQGFDEGAVLAAAGALKKGSLATLGALLSELKDRGAFTAAGAKEYLARREELTATVYAVARKLGVKVQNPRAYIETYAEKWLERGYDLPSLTALAAVSFKLGYGFEEMDGLIDELYRDGIVDATGVGEYCAAREKQFRLLQSVQTVCGVVKKTRSALDMAAAWKSWNFSDGMILEAAKRSAGAANPLAYMNKLLSEWKRTGVTEASAIPERVLPAAKQDFRSEAQAAADLRTEREHHYAVLRQAAISRAEAATARAEADEAFRTTESAIKRDEIALAKAEVFSTGEAERIAEELKKLREKRAEALRLLGLTEEELVPKFSCPKCSDTGFLPDGRPCDCYRG